MCLAVPMRVVEVDGFNALCEARGVRREVSLFLLLHEAVVPGDSLMVHLGQAVEKVSPERAAEAWALFDEVLALIDAEAPPVSAVARPEADLQPGSAAVQRVQRHEDHQRHDRE